MESHRFRTAAQRERGGRSVGRSYFDMSNVMIWRFGDELRGEAER